MWLASAVLMSATCLSLAQSDSQCACVPYFQCETPASNRDNCTDMYDVCCDNPVAVRSRRSSQPVVCGVRGKQADGFGNVIDWKFDDGFGNISTAFGEFPWMVAVFKVGSTGDQEFLCGGSIVHPNLILTTANTVSGLSAIDLRVKAGVWSTTDILESGKHQDRTVHAAVLHPGYDKLKVQNDFALLVLNDPLEMRENVATVCLPSANTVYDNTKCIATGWGVGNFGNKNIATELKKVVLPIVDSRTCQEEFRKVPKLGSRFNLHESFICAGQNGADTCTGDGGGPLVCPLLQDSGKYVQVGITSWGVGCGERPGVYSSVASARQWIDGVSIAYADNTPRTSG